MVKLVKLHLDMHLISFYCFDKILAYMIHIHSICPMQKLTMNFHLGEISIVNYLKAPGNVVF